MVPHPLPLAYAVYAFINVDHCERPLTLLRNWQLRLKQRACIHPPLQLRVTRLLQIVDFDHPTKGYDDILYGLGMCTLHERRNVICEQYFKNMQGNSHKLHHLLPEERCVHYDMRRENKYPLTRNRTNRYGKSLIPWELNNWQYF